MKRSGFFALSLFALAAARPAAAVETVVLMPFQNLSGAAKAPEAVSDALVGKIERRGYRVVRGEPVEEFLASERVRYLDSLPGPSREGLLHRFEASAVIFGTIFSFAESDNPVVALSARMLAADGKVIWSAVAGMSADDTKKVFGFGRAGSLDALAEKAISALARDFPAPGKTESLASARPKPIDLSSTRTFRSAAMSSGQNLVCVLPLVNQSRDRLASLVVGELLAQRLAASEGFRVVEASDFRKAMVSTGVYGMRTGDPEELKKLGAKVGTNLFLKGTIYVYKDVLPGSGATTPELELQLTLVDVAAGKILWTASLARKGSDYSGLLELGAISNAVALADQVVAEMIRAGESARPTGRPDRARAAAPAPTPGRPS
jgi:peptidoglycan-synthase activator LpoB